MFRKLLSMVRQDPPRISRLQSLGGIPAVPEYVESEVLKNGDRVLYIPRPPFFSGFLSRFNPKDPPPIRLILDELGSFVFAQINAERTVEEIVERFAEEMRVHRREAEASVVQFLNLLMRRGILFVLIPEEQKQSA